MNIRSSALIQSLSDSAERNDVDAASKEHTNAALNSIEQRSPSSRLLWIGSATLTGVVALAMLVVEGPLSSTTPAPSQGSDAEVVAPAR
ncbi:MAG: hypothetical protein AAF685_02920 [Cyanobacteria bacterium P01_C01_bin.89]